ncbi:MAG: metallophosphatase family protein [Opitutae bacterium]|nr:metallophosphatase family protein [Opitutae bacterium]MCD8298802.1 metallophosphatase family protein [Opitutae bacterium]
MTLRNNDDNANSQQTMENFGMPLRIGVISDTHGLVRPEIYEAFRSVDHILHAGDVGADEILAELADIALLSAVRGNIDTTPECAALPLSTTVRLGGAEIFLHHGHVDDLATMSATTDIVVVGHSHRPRIEIIDGILHVNPGSAGPRRFHFPTTVAIITLCGRARTAEIIEFSRE